LKRFVIDCSVVMAWCFEDETDLYADLVLDLFTDSEAIVPSIWPLEVANVLLVAERRKRLSGADSAQFIKLLSELPIIVDQETSDRALNEIFFIGRQQGLSSYDTAYLELAMREGATLATRDNRLINAARKFGVELVK
jgi:predicted nucleic acid-binding protein